VKIYSHNIHKIAYVKQNYVKAVNIRLASALARKMSFAAVAFPGAFIITALSFVFQVMGKNGADQFKRLQTRQTDQLSVVNSRLMTVTR
jgi:hypothetical protein